MSFSLCLVRTSAAIGAVLAVAVAPSRAATIAAFDFEDLVGLPKTGQQFSDSSSEGMGKMKVVHDSSSTVFADVVGNGSPSALSANNWTVNDYYDFDTATSGFKDINIKWSQTSSNAGPASFALFAMPFGAPVLKIADYTVGNSSWSSTSVSTASQLSFDLSSFPTLNDRPIMTFSLVLMGTDRADGGAGGFLPAGTNRIDNLVIEGTPIPLPVPGPLPLLGAVGAWSASRRIRRRSRL